MTPDMHIHTARVPGTRGSSRHARGWEQAQPLPSERQQQLRRNRQLSNSMKEKCEVRGDKDRSCVNHQGRRPSGKGTQAKEPLCKDTGWARLAPQLLWEGQHSKHRAGDAGSPMVRPPGPIGHGNNPGLWWHHNRKARPVRTVTRAAFPVHAGLWGQPRRAWPPSGWALRAVAVSKLPWRTR